RLFRPLAFTKTFVMLSAALVSITFAPALRDVLLRGKIRSEARHPLSRLIIRLYKPFVFVALRRPKSTVAIGLFAVLSAVPLALKLGHEFMPPLNEGDVLYMPTTFPNISIEEAKRQLQVQDRVLRGFPEVASVFGKVGRAETATDPAPLTMVETAVRLKPEEQWRKLDRQRWYSAWAPGFLKPVLGKVWPEQTPISFDELTSQMNRALQMPGWTNAWTMPIKPRVDMLTTGVRTPVGVKVHGSSLDEVERIGVALEGLLAPVPGTRSVLYERSQGGLYVDIVPDRRALARYGLTVGDVHRTIEAAIGGAPIASTVEGRNRFSINVRFPQDLRNDLEQLKRVLVPVRSSNGGGSAAPGGAMDKMGSRETTPSLTGVVALAMGGMDSSASRPSSGAALPARPSLGSSAPMLDVGSAMGLPMLGSGSSPMGGGTAPGAAAPAGAASSELAFVPLGQLADIRIVGGPPMIRDEGGFLVGYVYVDVDPARDVGGYVREAKEVVRAAQSDGTLKMPAGHFLEWTGQYELLEQMAERMKLVIPLTLLIVVLLLYLHFRNFAETLIVLLSIPFALVGSVWLLWAMDYRLSTAVWVGIIALVGLAAQTGIVMIVYIDNAYERRRQAGLIRGLDDIIWAHLEGTVMRVRPKLMTVSTMLIGLLPLLWATGSGADVMKRIAAPMVGGLLTSTFLTLEIIPVVYTYWRQEQLLWERLAKLDAPRLARLRLATTVLSVGLVAGIAAPLVPLYVAVPGTWIVAAVGMGASAFMAGVAAYLALRPAARRRVWPATE
ncbi:MAG: efflux RND transporter permease subunit, partial [Deltaproteobacteria bacterium]|nr:efflux RND transporter permease subunit [Deltaproteobacteria bacterium]